MAQTSAGATHDAEAVRTTTQIMSQRDIDALPNATQFEWFHKRNNYTPASFEEVLKFVVWTRKLFRDALAFVPEASDAQLRGHVFETDPCIPAFFDATCTDVQHIPKYPTFLYNATSRRCNDEDFAYCVRIILEFIKAKGDEKTAKNEILKLELQRGPMWCRDISNYVQAKNVPWEPMPEDMRALLASRREAGQTPGSHLLVKGAATAVDSDVP